VFGKGGTGEHGAFEQEGKARGEDIAARLRGGGENVAEKRRGKMGQEQGLGDFDV